MGWGKVREMLTREEYEKLMKRLNEENQLSKNNLILTRVNLGLQITLLFILVVTFLKQQQ